jgi:hypothetical protein
LVNKFYEWILPETAAQIRAVRASAATDLAKTVPSHIAASICGHTEQIAQEHYWKVGEDDLDQTISNLSTTHSKLSPTVAHNIAHLDVSKGPESSLAVSTPLDDETKKPKESLGFVSICRLLADAGFTLKIGDIGFEPTTSTMSTSKRLIKNAVKHKENGEDCERLHQCLHQIRQMIESYGPETLADALAELLGEEPLEGLADALSRRVANG